jgi:hypothetical protein
MFNNPGSLYWESELSQCVVLIPSTPTADIQTMKARFDAKKNGCNNEATTRLRDRVYYPT